MSYREFTLTNSKNVSWTLTDHSVKSFLNSPQGLGFQQNIGTVRYGESQVVTTREFAFPQVSGEVLFYDTSNANRYDLYNQFTRFLADSPFVLSYKIPTSPNKTYYLDCVVSQITKTESSTDGMMKCNLSLLGLGFWKSDEVALTGAGTTYTIDNDGDFPVGFEITIEGSLENPYVTLEQDSELYGEAKFDDSTAFDKVYVDSKDGEQNVILEQGGSVLPNPLSYQDLSISNGSIYVTFIKLARGTNTLTIGMDSGSITSVSIKYTPQYRSV